MSGAPQYIQCITSSKASGTSQNNYTTAKSVINATEIVPIPGNLLTVGSKLTVKVRGGISNIVTTPGTITFQVMMGSVVAFTSGAIQLNATAHTLLPFFMEIGLRVDSIGSSTSAKFLGQGWVNGIMFTNTAAQTDAANTTGAFPIPATAPAVGTGFDSTASNNLDFWAGFSIANSGNAILVYDYEVLQLIA